MVAMAFLALAFGSARPAVEASSLALAFAATFGSLPVVLVPAIVLVALVVLGSLLLR